MITTLQTKRMSAAAAPGHRLSFSPDDNHAVVMPALVSGSTQVFETDTGRTIGELPESGHDDVLFHPTGRFMIICRCDCCTVCTFPALALVARFDRFPKGDFIRAAFTHDGALFGILTTRCSQVWDTERWHEQYRYVAAEAEECLALSQRGRRSYCVSFRESRSSPAGTIYTLTLIDLATPSSEDITQAPLSPLPLVVSPDGRWGLVCTDYDQGRYHVWDLHVGRSTGILVLGRDPSSFCFSSDLLYLIQGPGRSAMVCVWNLATAELLRSFPELLPWDIRCAPTDTIFAAILQTSDGSPEHVCFASPLALDLLGRADEHLGSFNNTHRFSPRGRWFGSVTNDHTFTRSPSPLPSGTLLLTDLAPIRPAHDDGI